MTTASHQQKGQRWGSEKGNHAVHIPDKIGKAVRSVDQNMVRILGRNDPLLRLRWRLHGFGRGSRLGLEHAAGGALREMQPSPGQGLGQFHLAHRRTERLEPLRQARNPLGKLVDRLRQLDQGLGAFFLQPLHPRGDRCRRDQERLGCLLKRPCPSRLDLEDRHPFDRRIMRPTRCRDQSHAGILDTKFLPEQSHLALKPVVFRLESYPSIDTIRRPAPRVGTGILGQTDHLKHGRLDQARPVFGQAGIGLSGNLGHSRLQNSIRGELGGYLAEGLPSRGEQSPTRVSDHLRQLFVGVLISLKQALKFR